jgi:hypothetical protein
MSDTTPAAMQRLLAAEFERQGWDYDLSVGRDIVEEAERRGEVDGAALAKRVSVEFLARTGASREDVADAIDSAIGGRHLTREPDQALVINDNRYQVNLTGNSQINNSKLNVGDGTQINVDVNASKDNVLAAVAALLRSGLSEAWNGDAARDLASVIDGREDIGLNDVREITAEVVKADQPTQGKVKTLLGKIAVSGLGGALGTGLSAGLGELLTQLPT